MTIPLRADGNFTIYAVEVLYYPEKGEQGWSPVGPTQIANVPTEHRVLNPGSWDGKLKEPFHSFSSSGECWQSCGVYGTFDRAIGVQMLDLLVQHNKYPMRLVKLTITQTRRLIMSAQPGA